MSATAIDSRANASGDTLAEQPPATLLMEACGSARYWGRQAQGLGHQVVLLPPHAVRPYVVRNKTDRTDAKGLLEAVRNDETRPVPVKSEIQQAVTTLHRLRSTWLATRTARLTRTADCCGSSGSSFLSALATTCWKTPMPCPR
jgi:transposase